MTQSDPYENQAKLGAMVRSAAGAAIHNERKLPDLKRLNDIAVCEAFINDLADAGCMITRIPKGK